MKTKKHKKQSGKQKQHLAPQDHNVIRIAKQKGMYVMVTRHQRHLIGGAIYTFFSLENGMQLSSCTNEKHWRAAIDRAVERMQS
ncbi:MAG TPA: hypothetical protein PLN21_09335 [Gemmatales bacterium]|nr:hypothetical protein [Gemmatales bacterium]